MDSKPQDPKRDLCRVLSASKPEPGELKGDDIEIACRSVAVLSRSPKHPTLAKPEVVHTQDLAELKRWIGVDDSVAKGRCHVGRDQRSDMKELCGRCLGTPSSASTGRLTPFAAEIKKDKKSAQYHSAIRDHARSYLYGDSTQVSEAKPVLEAFYGNFEVSVWTPPKITVKSGSVLFFGPGANVLLASELIIEPGGQVVSYGSLTVKVGKLRKPIDIFAHAVQDIGLAAKTLFRPIP